jgi:hypothetical protein
MPAHAPLATSPPGAYVDGSVLILSAAKSQLITPETVMPPPPIVYKMRKDNGDGTDALPGDNDQWPVLSDEQLDVVPPVSSSNAG